MKTLTLTLVVVISIGTALAETQSHARLESSRAAAMALGQQLKSELQAAMQSAGPVAAVDVCHVKAPVISAQVSSDHSMEVGRTSLRLRNPDNAPDAWEQAVLERFEARKDAGEDIASLEHTEIVEEGERRSFRYMKAIATAPVCLSCHGGEEVSAAIEARLEQLYPMDQARGFSVGDIRGAFTIRQDL